MNIRHFVLGNGVSRSKIDLLHLRQYGKIYGCNALYREFSPDYLIAVDVKMIHEIARSSYQLTNEVWTNPNIKFNKYSGFKYFDPSLGWSSGPTALNMAAKTKPKEIFILGFDFIGIQGNVNNIYANTENYRNASDPATYHGNWQKQTESVIINNPNTKFYRLVDDTFYDTGWNLPNFRNLKYSEFFKLKTTWTEIRQNITI